MIAVLVGVWTAGFLIENPLLALAVAVVATATVLIVPVQPLVGGILAVLASILTVIGDVPFGSIDLVALFAVVGLVMGRIMRHAWPGALATAGFAVTSAWRDGLTIEKTMLCLCVFGSFWVFGRVVRARAQNAEAAVAAAIELAQRNPDAEAERAVAENRERLAGEATAALQFAVQEMQAAARAARDRLDTAELIRVRQRGASAVDDLRELLIVLRSGPPVTPKPVQATGIRRRPGGRIDVLTAVGAALAIGTLALTLDFWAPYDRWQVTSAVWVLYGGVVLAVSLRGAWPTAAALVMTAASGIVLLDAPDEPYSLLPAVGAYLLVTWTVVTAGRHSAWWAAGATALTGVAVGARYGEHGIGFIALVFTVAVLAATAWGERDRLLREATRRSGVFQAHLRESVADALRTERLRAARELHDTASHAVGVMMLHTGAALAWREKDPAAARSALDTVVDQANDVLARFDRGEALFDERIGDSTDADVGRLIERMRAAGVNVNASLAPMPTDPSSARTVFRVVQEGLANSSRHAPGANVVVETARTERGYRVSVTDDGGSSGPVTRGAGFGLIGLRERVREHGGMFQAGRYDRGYRIEAILPDVMN